MKNRREDTGCCSRIFLKSIMIVFNIFFWVSGAFFLLVGVATYLLRHDYLALLPGNMFLITTYAMGGIGALVLLLGLIGCLGTMKEMRGCLIFYSFMLMLVFMAEACAGVFAYMYETNIHEELSRNLNRTVSTQYGVDPTVTAAVDAMQADFQCCGTYDYHDWKTSAWISSRPIGGNNNDVPGSCCRHPNATCNISPVDENIYTEGCILHLERFVRLHLILIGGIALGLSILQVFGFFFSCCMACKIKETDL